MEAEGCRELGPGTRTKGEADSLAVAVGLCKTGSVGVTLTNIAREPLK